MKRLFALTLLFAFAFAVCHAVPAHTGFDPPGVELSKKYFELQSFDMPVAFEVPKAPLVQYDLIVPATKTALLIVHPQSNSPPDLLMNADIEHTGQSYSMARWRHQV